MRAVVVMSRPQVGAAEVDSPAAALRELGCEVVPVGYDMDDLPDDLEHIRPAVVVVDAGPYLEVGRAVVKHAKQIPTLAEGTHSPLHRSFATARPRSRAGHG